MSHCWPVPHLKSVRECTFLSGDNWLIPVQLSLACGNGRGVLYHFPLSLCLFVSLSLSLTRSFFFCSVLILSRALFGFFLVRFIRTSCTLK